MNSEDASRLVFQDSPASAPLLFQNGIKLLFELWAATAASGHDAIRPIQVLALALQRPVGRLRGRDVAQVANLVCQLDLFGGGGQVRHVLDLQPLPLLLGQTLVVRHLLHQQADIPPEMLLQLLRRGLRVLDRVVENRSLKHRQVGNPADTRQDLRHRDRMVDVGTGVGVLAPLPAVLLRGKPQGCERRCR